jgi:Domain of unknown function (DUF6538)
MRRQCNRNGALAAHLRHDPLESGTFPGVFAVQSRTLDPAFAGSNPAAQPPLLTSEIAGFPGGDILSVCAIMAHAMPRKPRLSRNSYLQKRRQGWYVRVAVPQGLVSVIGKQHIVRSLQTRDVEVARKRRWPALAQIQAELAHQAGRADDPFWTPPWQNIDPVSEGLTAREDWLAADDQVRDPCTRYTEREELEHIFHEWAEEIEKKQGPDTAKAFWQIATSQTPMLRIVQTNGWRTSRERFRNRPLDTTGLQ